MSDIQITTLLPSKWQQYKDLRLRALKEESKAFGSSYADAAEDPDEMWSRRLQQAQLEEAQWLYFAKTGETIIGMVGAYLSKEKNIVTIIGMYVVKEYRGRGISKMLMSHLVERLINSNVSRAAVMVNTELQTPVNLYRKMGFEETEWETKTLGDGNEYMVVTMEKTLA